MSSTNASQNQVVITSNIIEGVEIGLADNQDSSAFNRGFTFDHISTEYHLPPLVKSDYSINSVTVTKDNNTQQKKFLKKLESGSLHIFQYGLAADILQNHLKKKNETILTADNTVSSSDMCGRPKRIYIFVNPLSGNQNAKNFITPLIESLQFREPKNTQAYIYNLFEDESGFKKGFLRLRNHVNALKRANEPPTNENLIRIIAAGGDGTVLWVLSELNMHKIDVDYVAIACLPYGTGNDLAKTYGWPEASDAKHFSASMSWFRKLACKIVDSRVCLHDIWLVKIILDENGYIEKINSVTRKKTKVATGSKTIQLCVESRVGVGFERNRTKSRIQNRVVYCWEGVKKSLKLSLQIHEIVSSLLCYDEGRKIHISFYESETSTYETLFGVNPENPKLLPCKSLILINIPNFAAGLDIWSPANEIAVSIVKDSNKANLLKKNQNCGDGLIEIVTYTSLAHMAVERFANGQGKRLAQAKGPFIFNFFPNLGKSIYFQVDGEFYSMKKPKQIVISHDYQTKILRPQRLEIDNRLIFLS